jgi:transposase InsO family protein
MVHDIPRINHIHQLCAEYITTKMKRSLFPS